MDATLEAFGRVDGCFANAGIGGGGRHAFIDRTEEQWRTMFATNLDGVFHVFQAAARHMTERAAGRRSVRPAGRDLEPRLDLRHRAQRALRRDQGRASTRWCRALAVELARHGVTANAILPGWIKSDMTAGIMGNDKFVANVMPRIPVRRFGEPADFGGIAVYLMSKASSYHTADMLRDRRRLYGVLSYRRWMQATGPMKSRPLPRHCERSEAIQHAEHAATGLLRRCTPRNDEFGFRERDLRHPE